MSSYCSNCIRETDARRYFSNIIDLVHRHRDRAEIERSVSLNAISYIERAIKEDLCISYISSPFYEREAKFVSNVIPREYTDKKGTRHQLTCNGYTNFYLSGHNFVCAVDSIDKMTDAAKNITQNDFRYDENNHICRYYDGMDFAVIDNGNHSISAGHILERGYVRAEVYDIRKMFPHIYTDGIYWYNFHTKEPIVKADDFRICTLYEIAKIRDSLSETIS